jgi:AAA+ ATPase superfamily predicted ATPase
VTTTPAEPIAEAEFVGRAAELRLLEDAWRRREPAFIPIYGRRRIGKSELILHFLRGKQAIYHVGKVAPAALQLREFLDESARILDEPLLAQLPATDWRAALEAVTGRAKGKLALILDEFQWSAGASPELPSVLQELWDRKWRKTGQVMLILCGSFVGFMEREVLGRKSPLFGRRTAQIHLQPFDYREAALFHPSWSLASRARAYFVCGGVPMYLKAFSPHRSIESNIEDNLLTEFSPMFREPEFLLREELREVETYHAVLHAIAAGHVAVPEIARVSGAPIRSLPYYLERLVQLGYVGRRYPLTGARPNPRSVRFLLDDPLLRFWFRFVFPHRSFIQKVGPAQALAELIRPQLDAYFGSCFERLCREALPNLYARERIAGGAEVGEYWDRQVQIDVVGVRRDGWIDLGECKWGPLASVPQLLAELEARALAFPNPKNATLGRRVFARTVPAASRRSRRQRQEAPVAWHSLDDLYEA